MAKKEWKPGCPTWEERPDNKRAKTQYKGVLARIINADNKRLPSKKLIQGWHRDLFDGIAPHPDYLGNFRNLDKVPYCVQDLYVHVNGLSGRPPDTVLADVSNFISEFITRIRDIDKMWRMFRNVKTVFAIDLIVKLAAWAHGEWVWIHPFINGNGRTARLWVNYVFVRYGLHQIAVRPRPDSPYGSAAGNSMKGRNHSEMEAVLLELLFDGYQDKIRQFFDLS